MNDSTIDEKVVSNTGRTKSGRRPPGYWEDFEHVREGLEQLVRKLGHFPSQHEMEGARNTSLSVVITKYHGGLTAVRERMGYEPRPEKPSGYWKDFAHIREGLEPLIKQLGRFPIQEEIVEYGPKGLADGIQRNYNGLTAVRERMGYPLSKKPSKYWQNFKNVRRVLKAVITQLGHFPTATEMRMYDGSLVSSIGQYHGGLIAVRERMGYELSETKPHGYWKDFELVAAKLQPIIDEVGGFPSITQIRKYNRSLPSIIRNHHGGLTAVRERMGYSPRLVNPPGYWEDFEHVQGALKQLVEELGHFPTQKEIERSDVSGLASAASRYHGGLNAVKVKLGYADQELEVIRQAMHELQ